jgi:hypothetical protein
MDSRMRTKTIAEQHNDRMWTIKSKMQDLLEVGAGSVEWIAPQDKDRESREYWGVCCVMKEVFEHDTYVDFFVAKEAFETQTDDEIARRFAEHVIGFPVGSPQDIERKKRYVANQVDHCEAQIAHWQQKRDKWQLWLSDLSGV